MKIIIKNNINKLKKDTIVELRKGYANFLINSQNAVIANEKNLEELKENIEYQKNLKEKAEEEKILIKKKFEKIKLIFELNSLNNTLLESVSGNKIIDCLKNKFGIKIEKNNLLDFKNLKEIGEKIIKIKLSENIICNLKVEIKNKNIK